MKHLQYSVAAQITNFSSLQPQLPLRRPGHALRPQSCFLFIINYLTYTFALDN